MFWNSNPSNWYRLSVSNFHSSVFLQPISAVHPILPAWRLTRATRSVGTWAWPHCSVAVRGTGAIGAGRHNFEGMGRRLFGHLGGGVVGD